MSLAYRQLTLRWQPGHTGDCLFRIIAVVCVLVLLALGVLLSVIDVPEQSRSAKTAVPERVAKFITEREKPKPPEPKPKPPPPKPVVKVEPEPKPEPAKIERKRPEKPREPVTEEQKKAREKASQSGLLAHMSELNDLMDTPEVSEQVKRSVNKSTAAKESAGHSAQVFTANASKGSGGVDASHYATTAGSTTLSEADLAATRAALAASDEEFSGSDAGEVSANERSQEEITLVMDRHKGQLQSLYNRARRSNPALKGKIVLAITIAPDGGVTNVKVVSSELNDASLESRIVSRIKTFKFGAKDVASVTVNYPIEFLP